VVAGVEDTDQVNVWLDTETSSSTGHRRRLTEELTFAVVTVRFVAYVTPSLSKYTPAQTAAHIEAAVSDTSSSGLSFVDVLKTAHEELNPAASTLKDLTAECSGIVVALAGFPMTANSVCGDQTDPTGTGELLELSLGDCAIECESSSDCDGFSFLRSLNVSATTEVATSANSTNSTTTAEASTKEDRTACVLYTRSGASHKVTKNKNYDCYIWDRRHTLTGFFGGRTNWTLYADDTKIESGTGNPYDWSMVQVPGISRMIGVAMTCTYPDCVTQAKQSFAYMLAEYNSDCGESANASDCSNAIVGIQENFETADELYSNFFTESGITTVGEATNWRVQQYLFLHQPHLECPQPCEVLAKLESSGEAAWNCLQTNGDLSSDELGHGWANINYDHSEWESAAVVTNGDNGDCELGSAAAAVGSGLFDSVPSWIAAANSSTSVGYSPYLGCYADGEEVHELDAQIFNDGPYTENECRVLCGGSADVTPNPIDPPITATEATNSTNATNASNSFNVTVPATDSNSSVTAQNSTSLRRRRLSEMIVSVTATNFTNSTNSTNSTTVDDGVYTYFALNEAGKTCLCGDTYGTSSLQHPKVVDYDCGSSCSSGSADDCVGATKRSAVFKTTHDRLYCVLAI